MAKREKKINNNPVELFANQFGWHCPSCEKMNIEEHLIGVVTCKKCKERFHALSPEVNFEDY